MAKKIKLPLWLKYFSSTSTGKELQERLQIIAKALKSGKDVICLKNKKPIRITYKNNKVEIEEIKNYDWEL